jgi:hypothetical protein
MYGCQQSARYAETDRGVSLFARILKNKQQVIEDGQGFFEGDTMLAPILGRLCLVPLEGRTSMFEDPVHWAAEWPSVFTM